MPPADFNHKEYALYDAHAHIYPEKISVKAASGIGKFYGLKPNHSGSVEELLANGAKRGVKGYLVCSVATTPEQVCSINDFIAEECKKHPEFIGFGSLHPSMDKIEEEILRILALGLRGIKLHPDFQRFNIDAPEAYRVYRFAENRLPILIHMGDDRYTFSRPHRLARVADDFQSLQVIAAHLGGYKAWDEAKDCLRRPNIWFDTSSAQALLSKEAAAEQIRVLGVDRCFFGTDYPLWNYQSEVDSFFALGLTQEENRLILSENFKSFFQIRE
jgi:predicted TIM-barrel fold metal-dependent hydrolase